MDIEEFTSKRTGSPEMAPNSSYYVFEPKPLPFTLKLDNQILSKTSDAYLSVGNLSGIGRHLKNPHLLITPYLKREAVLSSKIEGTRTTLSDVFLHEKDKKERDDDLSEVINYISALEYGLRKIREGQDISQELIIELHRILMSNVRGESKDPGMYRTMQNWISSDDTDVTNARFVPPAPSMVPHLMKNLFHYINDHSDETTTLIKAAIIHYQFETIHPFRDGNGRIGRLLIILYFIKEGIIHEPLFYLSAYFEQYKKKYINYLFRTSSKGELEEWVNFFLSGVKNQADDALGRAMELEDYRDQCIEHLNSISGSSYAQNLLIHLFSNPYMSYVDAQKKLGGHYSPARYAVNILIKAGILKEDTPPHMKKSKVFVASKIREILEK